MKRFVIYLMVAINIIFTLVVFSACKEEDMFTMQAKIVGIGDKIEVEVIDSQYASGAYWVITSDETEFFDNNIKTSKAQLNVGDVIEILYSGQVMMSYPPQIVAQKIVVL